mmetsp:Transcript_10697/g.44228  ORF Transcript_10697/g.44228 Transcript_10697/m.44228 type:complete len:242 (+) Transcript_10697:247-972(+)
MRVRKPAIARCAPPESDSKGTCMPSRGECCVLATAASTMACASDAVARRVTIAVSSPSRCSAEDPAAAASAAMAFLALLVIVLAPVTGTAGAVGAIGCKMACGPARCAARGTDLRAAVRAAVCCPRVVTWVALGAGSLPADAFSVAGDFPVFFCLFGRLSSSDARRPSGALSSRERAAPLLRVVALPGAARDCPPARADTSRPASELSMRTDISAVAAVVSSRSLSLSADHTRSMHKSRRC